MKLRVTRASRRSRKMKVQNFPVTSPFLTKNVSPSVRLMVPERTSGSHHVVRLTMSPRWSIIAEIPVLAQRAMSLRVSIALREA